MIVIKQFAAEFQIKLTAELIDALSDTLALKLYILVIGKTDLKHRTTPLKSHNSIKRAELVLQNSERFH